MAIDKFPYIFKKFVKSPIALMTRNQISTWPMWKSDFHMTHGEIVAHFTENWSCGNQISAWPKNSSNSSSSKWFLHGSCGNQISTWPMWKSDFFSLVQPMISRIFLKGMEIYQWPSHIVTHTGITILFCWPDNTLLQHTSQEVPLLCSAYLILRLK